jgi:oligopeptide/dipeptide ABC transporter ATP-binding protein
MGILPQHAYVQGTIIFKDTNLIELDRESMRKIRGNEISMIFQEPMTSLNPVLTVGYQIAEVLMTHRGMKRKAAMDQAVDILGAVQMPSPEIRLKEYPHQLSGGMRQRVMIAMAVACSPSLVIADEPTTALDVTIQAQILELLHSLRQERNVSILLITHDLGIIAENTSRVAIMYAGRFMEMAVTEAIFSNTKHPYTKGLLESLPKEKGVPLNPIPGFVPRAEELPSGCRFSDRCSYVIDRCRATEPEFIEVSSGHFARCIRTEEITWKS